MSAEPADRILAVDDHALLREGTRDLWRVSRMSLVAQASNGGEAIHQFRTHRRTSP